MLYLLILQRNRQQMAIMVLSHKELRLVQLMLILELTIKQVLLLAPLLLQVHQWFLGFTMVHRQELFLMTTSQYA